MASNVTEQVISSARQLADELERLQTTVSQLDDPNDILAHLTDLDQHQEALTTLQDLTATAAATESVSESTFSSIAESFSTIIEILDQLQTQRSSLIGRADPLSQLDPALREIADEAQAIYQRTCAIPGYSAVDAASAAETALHGRIQPLLTSGEISPDKIAEGRRFLEGFFAIYCNSYEADFNKIRQSSEGDVATDFYTVLGLYQSLDTFRKTREIPSGPILEHFDNLHRQMHDALTVYIASQIENEVQFPETVGAASAMEEALNAIITPQSPAPGAPETEEEDPTRELAEALALSQTPQHAATSENEFGELIAAVLLSLEPQSSSGSVEQSQSREILQRKLHSAEFLNTMIALTGAEDLASLEELAYTLEEHDAHAASALFALLQGLHVKLNKAQSIEEYGRTAFFNNEATTPAEREDVIKRALVLTLIDGIKETIKAGDIAQLRATLDLLSAIRLNESFQDYRNKDIASLIHGHLYKAHVDAGRPSSERKHGHFGRVALRDLSGFSAPKEVKLDAVHRLETELKTLWNI